MKTRPESKLVTEDPDNGTDTAKQTYETGNKKQSKRPDSKLVTEDPDPETDEPEKQSKTTAKKTKARADTEVVAGGSPSAGAVKGGSKHRDDSKAGSDKLEKQAVSKSEQQNLTQKKGYNEIPRSVPVKSVREKA